MLDKKFKEFNLEKQEEKTVEETEINDAENKEELFKNIELDDETLLSLLAFADKQKRIIIQPEWDKIVDYCNELDVAKYAHKLCKSSILAIGGNYVIVVVEHNHLATDLNNMSNQPGLTQFLLNKLNEELRVFAITNERSQQLIETFKSRAANNDLPEKIEIELIQKEEELTKDNLIANAQELFGKDGFIIEE